MELLERIKLNAKKHNKRIVLPEGYEERTIKAADIALSEGLAQIILLGNPEQIKAHAASLGLKNIGKALIVDPKSHAKKDHYIDMMVELRKNKGMTKEEASKLIEDPLYLGVTTRSGSCRRDSSTSSCRGLRRRRSSRRTR
jgi:phosphate acetyltransferase